MKLRTLPLIFLFVFSVSCTPFLPTVVPRGTPTSTPALQTILPFVTPTPISQPALQPIFPSCEPVAVRPIPATFFSLFPTPTPSHEDIPSLRLFAEQRGLLIGAGVSPDYLFDAQLAEILSREFNTLIPENAMKWAYIHPQPDRYDFQKGDAIVTFAHAHGMNVYGHVLVWDIELPRWVREGDYPREEWINILCTHIKTLVHHYRGMIFAWHVVNEAFDDQGLLRDTIWLRNIGPEYIAMAFQWAHEADPGALLVYNDHGGEGLNAKSQAIYALAQGLLSMGIPIHAIGLQMHIWLDGPPTSQDLLANMQRIAELGLQIHITEMDVRTQNSPDSQAAKMQQQAETYRRVFQVCLQVPNCKVFITWGLTDRYSWIPQYTGKPDAPLLFDENNQPKPAYYAILEELQKP